MTLLLKEVQYMLNFTYFSKVTVSLLFILLPFFTFSQYPVDFTVYEEKPLITARFNHEGNFVASVGTDKTIKIWNISQNKLEKKLFDNNEGEVAIDFSPDDKYLASGSWDKDVKIWDLKTGKVITRLKGHTQALRSVCYHPGGKLLASAGWDRDINIWYAESGLLYKKFSGHKECIRTLAFSPDGRYLASAGYDLYIKIWDITTGLLAMSFKAHKMPVESLSYRPDGKYIASGSTDNAVKVWDAKTGKLVRVFNGHKSGIYCVNYSPNGKLLTSSSNDKTIKIWDIYNNKCVSTIVGHKLSVKSTEISPNGDQLLSASFDKSIKLHDISSLKIEPTDFEHNIVPKFHSTDVLTFSYPTGDYMEVYNRHITIKSIINDDKFSNYHLFNNKKEYTKYDGTNKSHPNPEISGILNELMYHVYLEHGNNEIIINANNDQKQLYSFTKPININYHNLSKQIDSSDLYVLIINPSSYNDKKLNKNYVSNDSDNLKSYFNTLNKRLYKSINIEELNYFTKDDLTSCINKIKQKLSPNDDIIIINTAYIFNSGGNYMLAPQNVSKKDLINTSVKLSDLIKGIAAKANSTNIILDLSNKMTTKGTTEFQASSLGSNISKSLSSVKNHAILTYESSTKGDFFIQIQEAFKNVNDFDRNFSVDILELKNFLNKRSSSTLHSQGRKIPLFISNKFILED